MTSKPDPYHRPIGSPRAVAARTLPPEESPVMVPVTEPAGLLTRLPLWARHLLLLLVPGLVLAAGLVLRAVVDAGGVLTAVDWPSTGATIVAGLAGWALLVLTPLERRYGVGSPTAGGVGE